MSAPPVVVSTDYMAKAQHRLRGRLPMWVVYRPTTREYPGFWVARMHVTLPAPRPTRFVITHDTLADLRGLLPVGLANFGRQAGDGAEIEEVWF